MVVAERVNPQIAGIVRKTKPMTYARVTIIDGEQGSGKSETAVSFGVNAMHKGMTSIGIYRGLDDAGKPVFVYCKAQPILSKRGFPIIGYAKIWLPNQEPRIMKIPPKSLICAEGVRVIYNGHLWGVRYVHMELKDIIKHLNDGTIRDCILIIDEAYITADRREGMSPLVKAVSKLSKQLRKRHIHLIMCTPDSTELDLRFQKIEVEHIVCSYDEMTQMVTKYIRNRKKYKRPREVSYDGRLYRKYYDTDEIYELTDIQIERAMAMAE